ncbi:MAG: alpha/beta fold hydrolase [Pseudomonadota bacterium]
MSGGPAAPVPGFDPPRWLRGAHAQTIYASRFCPRPAVAYRRERWDTPDGDFIDVDRLAADAQRADAPWLVLFHGLEGSSQSHYARTLMHMAETLGWHGAVAHFRGCGGEPNRLARAYHSGDTAEVDWILRRFAACAGGAPLHVAGISLGGNVLMKWLGEQGSAACAVVDTAISISAPVDLAAAGAALERGFARVYALSFLQTLKRKAMAKLLQSPGLFDAARLGQARTMRAFDDVFTAPLHGYRDVDDYWMRASCKPGLGAVAVRSLMINALDDPFLPASALPGPSDVSPCVTLDYPAAGGHVGFVAGNPPGHARWLARRVAHFLGAPLEAPCEQAARERVV